MSFGTFRVDLQIDFALEIYEAVGNKDRLNEIGDMAFDRNQLELAAKAYQISADKSRLNKIGDTFLKEGILSAAMKCYECSQNDIMVKFIKENFSDKDREDKLYL